MKYSNVYKQQPAAVAQRVYRRQEVDYGALPDESNNKAVVDMTNNEYGLQSSTESLQQSPSMNDARRGEITNQDNSNNDDDVENTSPDRRGTPVKASEGEKPKFVCCFENVDFFFATKFRL